MKIRVVKEPRKSLVEKRKLTQGGDASKSSKPKAGLRGINEAPEKPIPDVVKKSMMPDLSKKQDKETGEKKPPGAIPKLVKKYMVKKYKFIGTSGFSPGGGDEVEISGVEIAEEFFQKSIPWVTNEDSGKWVRAHEHPEIIKVIDWIEDKVSEWGYENPLTFAKDLKTLSPSMEKQDEKKPTGSNQRIFYFKKGKAWQYPSNDNTTGKWTAMEIAEYMRGLSDDELTSHNWTAGDTTGAKTKWADVSEQPLVDAASMWLMKNSNKFGQDYKDEKKGEITISKHDFKGTSLEKNEWIMEPVMYLVPGKLIPKKDVGYKILQHFMRTMEDLRVSKYGYEPNKEWKPIMDIHDFAVAYRHVGGEWPPKIKKVASPASRQTQTVKGIKVLIGSKQEPCQDYSPMNSEKPLGNKQFDPQSPDGIDAGRWECNTQVEQEILHVIEDFVSANRKPRQEIINTIINITRDSEPGEPLHSEDDIDFLFRGSSRQDLAGNPLGTQAIDVLKAIDWSKEVSTFWFDKNKWVKLKYGGKFELAFPVASWTDQRTTAAQFAKGGPSQNTAGARPFQFIYEASPSAAKAVQGTFLNFDELYKLQGNSKAVGSGVEDMFHGFGGYQSFDNEILLLGQEGSAMPVEHIWVNWDFLVSLKTKGLLHKEAPGILKQILKLEKGNPDLRVVAAVQQFEKWYDLMSDAIMGIVREWQVANDALKKDYEKSQQMKGDPRGVGGQQLALMKKEMKRKYPKEWFKRYEDMARDFYNEVSEVYSRHRFEHKKQIWNQKPEHPWYNLPHKVLMTEDVRDGLLKLQDKASWLGSQIRAAEAIIQPDPDDTDGGKYPDPYASTEVLEEDEREWHERYADIERRKGMRSTLTGAAAGNKFVPATGMKNTPTNDKSKSPPPGVGVLEEEPMPNSCSVCGTAHEGPCHNPALIASGIKLKIR
jgi:hypothetical protein